MTARAQGVCVQTCVCCASRHQDCPNSRCTGFETPTLDLGRTYGRAHRWVSRLTWWVVQALNECHSHEFTCLGLLSFAVRISFAVLWCTVSRWVWQISSGPAHARLGCTADSQIPGWNIQDCSTWWCPARALIGVSRAEAGKRGGWWGFQISRDVVRSTADSFVSCAGHPIHQFGVPCLATTLPSRPVNPWRIYNSAHLVFRRRLRHARLGLTRSISLSALLFLGRQPPPPTLSAFPPPNSGPQRARMPHFPRLLSCHGPPQIHPSHPDGAAH